MLQRDEIILNLQPSRILVCQQRQIGDVLLATPALELLRRRFPKAAIHVLTESKCTPVLVHNPHIDHVWSLDKGSLPTLWDELQWYKNAARQGYDLLINFQPTLPRLHWVVFFSKARVRLSGPVPWYLRPLYTHIADWLDERETCEEEYQEESCEAVYASEAKIRVLSQLGITWRGERPRLYLTQDETVNAARYLDKIGLRCSDTLVTIAPAHKRTTRQWPTRHYAQMIEVLTGMAKQKGLVLRFLPVWGPGEIGTVRELVAHADANGVADSLIVPDRMFTLREMAACISRASLHIGNCSSPRHIAVAVGTPTCTAHGSTGPEWICPAREGQPQDHVGLFSYQDCQPCERNACRKSDDEAPCLVNLTPDRMAEAAFRFFKKT